MSSAPRFSIVIPCFNQGTFLKECLESVAAQTLPAHEVVVVDDGSTDPYSVRRIDELCQGQVRLVRQVNRGLSGARNSGIRAAQGDWILPLDADDKLETNALATYAEAIARTPEVDIWYPDIRHFGLQTDVWPAVSFNRWRQLWYNQLVCSSAIRRKVFDSGVFYNENLRKGYEDWEFYVHACCEKDFVARELPAAIFRYRRWGYTMLASSNERAAEIMEQMRRERPIYGDPRALLEIKRRWAPGISIAAQTPALAVSLRQQEFQDFNLVDESGRVQREGDLRVFHQRPSRAMLVSYSDGALGAALESDPFLLEKVARAIDQGNHSILWLVLAEDENEAYPGFLYPSDKVPANGQPWCIGFVLDSMQAFDSPEIPRSEEGLIVDLARYVQKTHPYATRPMIVGARSRVAANDGFQMPPMPVRPTPPPPLSPSRRRIFEAGRHGSKMVRTLVGENFHDRVRETSAFTTVRNWVSRERAQIGGSRRPSVALAPRHGAFDAERIKVPRHRETWWAAIDERPSLPTKPSGSEPALLIVAPWIIHGGADRAIVDFVHGLTRLGATFPRYLVTTLPARMSWANQLVPHLHGVFSAPDHGAQSHKGFIAELVTRLGIGTVLIVNSEAGFDALPLIRQAAPKTRVVVQLHGFEFESQTGEISGHPSYVASRYNNLVDAYAPISQFIAEMLTERFYVSPSKLHPVYLGIDSARFAAARRARLEEAPARVLWLGRFSEEKDPFLAVQVAAAWKARHGSSRLKLTMVGDGWLRPEVEKKIAAEGLGDVVSVQGPYDDPMPLYREADCLLMTSRYEGVPLVVYEAMCAGVPVVASVNQTAIAEVLPEEDAYFVRDQSDPASYVAALESVLADPADARARAARAMARSIRYDTSRYTEELLQLVFPKPHLQLRRVS